MYTGTHDQKILPGLLGPFCFAYMYMFPELIVWDKTIYVGEYPLRKMILLTVIVQL